MDSAQSFEIQRIDGDRFLVRTSTDHEDDQVLTSATEKNNTTSEETLLPLSGTFNQRIMLFWKSLSNNRVDYPANVCFMLSEHILYTLQALDEPLGHLHGTLIAEQIILTPSTTSIFN